MQTTKKKIFFEDWEIAQRFTKLYGGMWFKSDKFYEDYYGLKNHYAYVMLQNTKDEMEEIMKWTGIKKKRNRKGRTYYLYE